MCERERDFSTALFYSAYCFFVEFCKLIQFTCLYVRVNCCASVFVRHKLSSQHFLQSAK